MAMTLAQFRLAYQSSPVPTMISRLSDGVILDVNKSFLHLTGHVDHDVIGQTARGLSLWADNLHGRISGELRERGAMVDLASTIRTKANDERRTLTSLQIIELDGQPCVM